jgi:hypothetical protein
VKDAEALLGSNEGSISLHSYLKDVISQWHKYFEDNKEAEKKH